jgi:hypothetical protein
MAPKRPLPDDADLSLRQQLAEMKQVPLEQVGRLRMTPKKFPALVDVGVVLTGKSAHDVARDLRIIMDRHPDLGHKISQVSFGGRGGNRESLVPKDLATLVEVIFFLPGRAAAQVRQAAAQIFVRYLGGDLTLISEIQRMHHVQEHLKEADPDHPLRAFGSAVEAAKKSSDATLQLCRRNLRLVRKSQQIVRISHLQPQRSACLPEVCLDWVKDLGVCRNELAGVKSQFKTLVQIEIASGQIPAKSPTEAWIRSPPVRFKGLADGALASYRSLLRQRYDAIAVGGTLPGIKKTGKRLHGQSSESSSDDEDDILKISEVMRVAGVWTAVWSSFRSDLANQMLSLKCAETNGSFSDRRHETVQGHITVLVHKYKKSSDWPLAWKALQNTRDVYQKRVREFLESMYILAGYPADEIEHASAELARAIAVSLKVMPSSN